MCPNNCNNKGACVDGNCICDPGYTMNDCREKGCPNHCSGNCH